MKFIHTILMLLFFSFFSYTQTIDPSLFEIDWDKINSAKSNLGMSVAASEEAERADQMLNLVYNQILEKYRENPNFVEQLRNAQRAWITYRDYHLYSVFPFENSDSDARNYVGNGYGYERSITLAEITWTRVILLYKWIDDKNGFGSDGVFSETYFP